MTRPDRSTRTAVLAAVTVIALHLGPAVLRGPAAQAPVKQDPSQQDPAAGAPRVPKPMPLPRAVAVHRGDRKISVDGSLQDWPDLVPMRLDDLRQISGTARGAWLGPSDLTARFFLLWDDEALWFGGQVIDEWHTPLTQDRPRGLEVPPADAIVLTFDPERDTATWGPGGGRVEDRTFWIGDAPGPAQGKLVLWDRLRGGASYVDGGRVEVRRVEEAKRTDVEVRIPWSAILPPGRTPRKGDVLDLQVTVEDHDEPTDPIAQTRLGWTFGTGTRVDPGLLGSVILLESFDAKGGAPFPDIPPPEESLASPDAEPSQWIDFLRDLRQTRPVVFDKDSVDAPLVGGEPRMRLLRRLEASLRTFPRVDASSLAHRVNRRMRREVEGIVETGIPFFWHHALKDVSRRAMDPPPTGMSFRLFRLPTGGWMVRSGWGNFGIDPCGHDVENLVWGGMDFVLLTSPLDETKRNDELLLRMRSVEPPRPVYSHLPFHLPRLPIDAQPVVQLGRPYKTGAFTITPHAPVDEDGKTTSFVGYAIEFPDGARLVVTGPSLLEEHVRDKVDLLLLDARHPRARVVGQRVRANLTVLDNVLQAHGPTLWGPRVDLEEAYTLQRGLLPNPSLMLAPGEFVDVLGGGD